MRVEKAIPKQSIIPQSIIIHYNILFKYDLTEMSVCLTVEEIIFHSVVVCCDGAQEERMKGANETTTLTMRRERKRMSARSERVEDFFHHSRGCDMALRYVHEHVVLCSSFLRCSVVYHFGDGEINISRN